MTNQAIFPANRKRGRIPRKGIDLDGVFGQSSASLPAFSAGSPSSPPATTKRKRVAAPRSNAAPPSSNRPDRLATDQTPGLAAAAPESAAANRLSRERIPRLRLTMPRPPAGHLVAALTGPVSAPGPALGASQQAGTTSDTSKETMIGAHGKVVSKSRSEKMTAIWAMRTEENRNGRHGGAPRDPVAVRRAREAGDGE